MKIELPPSPPAQTHRLVVTDGAGVREFPATLLELPDGAGAATVGFPRTTDFFSKHEAASKAA